MSRGGDERRPYGGGAGHAPQTQAQGKGSVQVQPLGQVGAFPAHRLGLFLQVPCWQVWRGTQSSLEAQAASTSRQYPSESVTTEP